MNRLLPFLCFLFLLACEPNNKKNTKGEAPEVTKTEDAALMVKEGLLAKAKKEKIKAVPLPPDYDTLQWTELIRIDSSFLIDLKYATTDNFVEEQMYDCPRCFLRPVVAKKLQELQEVFKKQNLRIKLFDCYRPASVQQRLWDKVPNASYVTPPSKGSMHNRGLAVDVTLVNRKGEELDMGTAYDFFGRKAHHTCTDLPKDVLANRLLLKSTMEAAGFRSIRTEWWHYSFPTKKDGIADMNWNCEGNH